MRIEDFLKKERREIMSHLTFASILTLILALAAAGYCWSYGLSWMIVAFLITIIIVGSALLFGDLLIHGESFVKQEILLWQNLIQRLLRSDFVWAFSGLWGLATLLVMIPFGVAAYIKYQLLGSFLAVLIVGSLSVLVYFLLPPILEFLFKQVVKGPEGVDDED